MLDFCQQYLCFYIFFVYKTIEIFNWIKEKLQNGFNDILSHMIFIRKFTIFSVNAYMYKLNLSHRII